MMTATRRIAYLIIVYTWAIHSRMMACSAARLRTAMQNQQHGRCRLAASMNVDRRERTEATTSTRTGFSG